MANVKIVIDKQGMRELLHAPEIRERLTDAAEAVARAAGPTFEVQQWDRPTRAVVNVIDPTPGALFREASTGKLSSAVEGTKI